MRLLCKCRHQQPLPLQAPPLPGGGHDQMVCRGVDDDGFEKESLLPEHITCSSIVAPAAKIDPSA